jgi:hypothetical protein
MDVPLLLNSREPSFISSLNPEPARQVLLLPHFIARKSEAPGTLSDLTKVPLRAGGRAEI